MQVSRGSARAVIGAVCALVASLLLAAPAHAKTFYVINSADSCLSFGAAVGAAGYTSASENKVCVLQVGTLPKGDDVYVLNGWTLKLDVAVVNGTISSFRNQGEIHIDAGSTFIPNFYFTNTGGEVIIGQSGSVVIDSVTGNWGYYRVLGTMTVLPRALFINHPGGEVIAGGPKEEDGELLIDGRVVNAGGYWDTIGPSTNNGVFVNDTDATFTHSGTFTNNATFTNKGIFNIGRQNSQMFEPTFMNNGILTNEGTFTNYWFFKNSCSGTVNGTILGNPVIYEQNCNTPPIASDDMYYTNEDTALTVAAPGVLGNDDDVDAEDTLTAALVRSPSHGTLALDINGSFLYTPAANFNGADSFTYTANDGPAASNIATVSIDVAAVNDVPTVIMTPSVCTSDTAASGQMLLSLADVDTDVRLLMVEVTSSNSTLLPNSHVSVTGTGDARTLSVAAVGTTSGTSTLTVVVSDGTAVTSSIRVVVGTSGRDTLTGTPGVDMLFGLAGVDTLNGGDGADLLCGGNRADVLNAGAGNDVLAGGRGPDRLIGGDGDDTLTGGLGGDFFSGGLGVDVVTDFTLVQGDTTDNT